MSSVACPWRDAPPVEALWCRVGEEEEEEEEFDNTCALPRYRSQRCGRENKVTLSFLSLRSPTKMTFLCHRRYPSTVPTSDAHSSPAPEVLSIAARMILFISLMFPSSKSWSPFSCFDTNQYVHRELAKVICLHVTQPGEILPSFGGSALTSSHKVWRMIFNSTLQNIRCVNKL